jgi:hypothetical protein
MKGENKMRKYLPSTADLIDRLSIDLLKQIFIPEKKIVYVNEINDILFDLDELLKENKKIELTGSLIRAILLVGQLNTHIWYNESAARGGGDQDLTKLKLTHSINGLRNLAKNRILEALGEKKGFDYKVDCLAADHKQWEIDI